MSTQAPAGPESRSSGRLRGASGRPHILHVVDAGPPPAPGLLDVLGRSVEPADAFPRACALAIRRHAGARHTALLLSGSAGERAAHAMGLRTFDRVIPRTGVCPARRVRRFIEAAGPFDAIKAWSASCEEIVRRAAPTAQLLRAPALGWNEGESVTHDWETLDATLEDPRAGARAALGIAPDAFAIALIADPPDSAEGFEAQRVMTTLEAAGFSSVGVLPARIRGRDRARRHARAFGLRGPLHFVPTVLDTLAPADAAVILPVVASDDETRARATLARLWWAAEAFDRRIPLVTTFSEFGEHARARASTVVHLAPDATAHDIVAALIPIRESGPIRMSAQVPESRPIAESGVPTDGSPDAAAHASPHEQFARADRCAPGGPDVRTVLLRRLFFR